MTDAILLGIGKVALSLYPGFALAKEDPTTIAFTSTGLAGLNTIVGAFVGVYAYGVWEMILPAKRGDYFNPSNGVAAKGLIVGLVASVRLYSLHFLLFTHHVALSYPHPHPQLSQIFKNQVLF